MLNIKSDFKPGCNFINYYYVKFPFIERENFLPTRLYYLTYKLILFDSYEISNGTDVANYVYIFHTYTTTFNLEK